MLSRTGTAEVGGAAFGTLRFGLDALDAVVVPAEWSGECIVDALPLLDPSRIVLASEPADTIAQPECVVIETFTKAKVGEFPADWKPRKDAGKEVYRVMEESGLRFLRATARGLGIQAAKQTPNLLPLCHPLLVGSVFVNFQIEEHHVMVEAQVETVDRTGVEMEAMTACSVAALTIYDMCKSTDRSMTIGELTLWEKTGGRSGSYRRHPDAHARGSHTS